MIEHDAVDEAVLHACLAQDYDECVQLVRRFGPANLSVRYGLRTLRSVLTALPRHYLDHEPALGISEALVLSKEGRVSDARRLIHRLRDKAGGHAAAAGELGDLDLLDIMLACHADQPLMPGLADRLSAVAAALPRPAQLVVVVAVVGVPPPPGPGSASAAPEIMMAANDAVSRRWVFMETILLFAFFPTCPRLQDMCRGRPKRDGGKPRGRSRRQTPYRPDQPGRMSPQTTE